MVHIVFFDGVCNLCNWSVDFIIKRDIRRKFRYASLQSDFAIGILDEKGADRTSMGTIMLLKNDQIYTRSNAVLEILRDLCWPWPILYIFKVVPGFIRDAIYKFISSNRYRWFGKQDTCRVPSAGEKDLFMEKPAESSQLSPA